MTFVNLKNATLGKLVENNSTTNLWVVDKLPSNINPMCELVTAVAEPNDTITDIIKKWLSEAGIIPHLHQVKRDVQFQDLITHNPWLVFLVREAHLLSKKSFINFFLIAEKTKGVVLQGDILELGGKIFNNDRFMQRVDIGVHVNDAFE